MKIFVLALLVIIGCSKDSSTAETEKPVLPKAEPIYSTKINPAIMYRTEEFSPREDVICYLKRADYYRESDSLSCVYIPNSTKVQLHLECIL